MLFAASITLRSTNGMSAPGRGFDLLQVSDKNANAAARQS